jgi:septal ring factor EnvC (AmiA/AmiB activator)
MKKELQIYDWNLKVDEKKKNKLEKFSSRATSDLKRKKILLKKKLRAIYKIYQYPKPILSHDNSTFLVRKYLQTLVLSDIRSIRQDKNAQKEALKSQLALEEREERIKLYKERVLKQKEAIKKEKTAKEQLLAALRDKRDTYEKNRREFEEASKKLSALIKSLQNQGKKRFADKGFRVKKGNLSWPIKGKITTFFGKVKHPRLNYYIFNKGIDIKANSDSSVQSIETGKVLFADRLRGYGNLLIIDHGEGYYSLYAHLYQMYVKVGDLIQKSQIVATVGDNNSPMSPSLYFELRHHGKPENPLQWLAKKP